MEQNATKKFRGLEITMENIRMEEQLLPKGYTGEDLPYKPLDFLSNMVLRCLVPFLRFINVVME